MANRILVFILVTLLWTVSKTEAANTPLARGGVGMMFPDTNNFSNPGQVALIPARSLELFYGRENSPVPSQAVGGSAVYSKNGVFAVWAYGNRSGSEISYIDTSNEVLGAGFAVAMSKQRLTLGLNYERPLDGGTTYDGLITTSINWNKAVRKGLVYGASYSYGLKDSYGTAMANLGVGWGFNYNFVTELNINFLDLYDLGNFGFTLALNSLWGKWYAGLGGAIVLSPGSTQVIGRLGYQFIKRFDLSAYGTAGLGGTASTGFGATVRFAF